MNTDRSIPDLLPTRHSLLSRLRNWDDQEGWRDFFQTYWRLIYDVALKAGLGDADAQEVVQETVISVAKEMPGFRYDPGRGRFKGWLLQITRRRIADQVRKRIRADGGSGTTFTTTNVDHLSDSESCDLEKLWNEEWETHLVAAALENLRNQVNPEHYQLFDLYVVQQWPVRKIAATLGVSAGQVYLAKHRVGGMLKQELQRLKSQFL